MNHLNQAPPSGVDPLWFKNRSLELLAEQLAEGTYPEYPPNCDRLYCDDPVDARRLIAQPGPWWTEPPIDRELRLHPWFDEMTRNQAIGALAGRGFYWELEENETADGILLATT